MARKDVPTTRVQVYLNDPKVISALNREARAGRAPLSQAAGRAIARGLQKSPTADPEDRLLRLERSLRDHMRATARDMQIIQELVVELARVFLLRLPDTSADEDPILQAAAERSVERLVDATAARVISGERMARERARAAEQEPPQRAPAEPRSYGQAAQ